MPALMTIELLSIVVTTTVFVTASHIDHVSCSSLTATTNSSERPSSANDKTWKSDVSNYARSSSYHDHNEGSVGGGGGKVLLSPVNRNGEPFLTFSSNSTVNVFLMVENNAFIQLDGEGIPTFQLRLCREISFQFRTRLPHGLLVYHSVKNRPEGSPPYALYIIVEKGQLKVVHVFGKHLTSITVGKGLNRDVWHNVVVRIDVHGAKLLAKVDNNSTEISLQGLHVSKNYGIPTDLKSVVLIGGLSPEERLHGVKYIIESFVGCIKDIVLSSGKAASALLPINPLIATKHENVREGCVNKCYTKENTCFFGSKCINHYSHFVCDCFGTLYEGEFCDIYRATYLTLRGSSYVSYRVYDWKDRVHSFRNIISLQFKTLFDDSALFYASGEHHADHYIAASISNGSVIVEIDLGDGDVRNVSLGKAVNDNRWYNLTIRHDKNDVDVILNDMKQWIRTEGPTNYLYIDPEIYVGGGPKLDKKIGLKSANNFIGTLKYIFFNDISILYELKKANPKVHYIGVLNPDFTENDVRLIPITFPFATSYIRWPIANHSRLQLRFEFKHSKNLAVLAASEINTAHSDGYWELRVVNEEIRFEMVSNLIQNITQLVTVKYDPKQTWHSIETTYENGRLNIAVDRNAKATHLFTAQFNLSSHLRIGSGLNDKSNLGLIGCVQNITVDGILLDPRPILKTDRAVGHASLDNCQLVDPCKGPESCKHGGKCSVKLDTVICDCNNTGYIGKKCHFAQFRKTCEELAMLGYTKPDVYLIDIDGNGPFPPAHVKCEFQSLEDWKTKTIVEHNLPSQMDVRSIAESDFSFTIRYREFTPEMLKELIAHSLNCSQYIKYDCFKAPLELYSATWFVSAAGKGIIDYIGNVKRGSCPCSACNCDKSQEDKWLSDEGYYVSPSSLGITKMVFLKQKDLPKNALGRISLGPLECVEANTQRYVVTFTTSQSYIEVPGWRKGDIAFSFRTTGDKAILLYQPPIRRNYPSFMVVLTSDFELTFNFTLNTGDSRELEIKSQRRLNSGEWQKIWIDYNKHHVRFMINTDYQIVDFKPYEEFGPFEGSMFIGGAVENLVVKGSVYKGLVGCFRGLVVNGEILDIYSYMSVHLSEIIKECKPKCDPNPCQNGAKCKELWNRFECVCENPWAYSGIYCEENINVGGITFITKESYLKKHFLFQNMTNPERFLYASLMIKKMLLNIRTYDIDSLILYANDNLNNFVHLYISNRLYVTFLFNYGTEIHNISVQYPGLNSGKSIQIAVIRNENETLLYVNEYNNSISVGIKLLTEYSNKPWINPKKEVLSPPRPPAPPMEYFQVHIGGYESESLIPVNNHTKVGGYVGCMRGLKIGETLIHLVTPINSTNHTDVEGVLFNCRMKCDEEPCKNKGICIEDFATGENRCDCEHTSYYGDYCALEKGADFSGDSILQRKFVLEGPVQQIKVQLAFSTGDKRQKKTALLLLQTVSKRSYYLLVALSAEGELIFEEDREGSVGTYGVHLKDRNFINEARHSVYYKRIDNTSVLMVDRELVSIGPIPYLLDSTQNDTVTGENEVQIGGVNTTDLRFHSYKSYGGCLSNVYIEVNNNSMKPLDEYMLFTKTGSENVNVTNSQGVRSAKCAYFDVIHKPQPGLSLNISANTETAWVEDPPERVPYTSFYTEPVLEEYSLIKVMLAISICSLTLFFGAIGYHMYLTHVKWKRNKEKIEAAAIRWSRRQSLQYQEAIMSKPIILTTNYKLATNYDNDVKRIPNGIDIKPILKTEHKANVQSTGNKYNYSEKDELALVELKNQKDRLKSSCLRGYLNKAEREILYEPIEEITEHMDELTEELTEKNKTIKVTVVTDYIENENCTNKDDDELKHPEDERNKEEIQLPITE